jgi:ParB-like chromosome segregation protein Spo0J
MPNKKSHWQGLFLARIEWDEDEIDRILPDLAPWEYEALKQSIRRWGVIVHVVKDGNGDIIDGHQRVRACEELGITDYSMLILARLTADEKRDHAYILNLARRRLNQEQQCQRTHCTRGA